MPERARSRSERGAQLAALTVAMTLITLGYGVIDFPLKLDTDLGLDNACAKARVTVPLRRTATAQVETHSTASEAWSWCA
jgi:hypothetical protein